MARRIDIKSLRDRFGLSQPELAKRLGVGERSVRRWEAGLVDPSPMAVQAIQRFADEADKSSRKDAARRSPGRASGEDIGTAPPTNESEAPKRRPVAHLPGDERGADRLAPLAAVLPSMGRT